MDSKSFSSYLGILSSGIPCDLIVFSPYYHQVFKCLSTMNFQKVAPYKYLITFFLFSYSVQFSSVTQPCPIPCNPMDYSTPGLPVHHQLPELTQTHVHWVSNAIQPSHPLSSPFSPTFSLSQRQSFQMSQLFTSGGQSIGVSASTSVLPMIIQDWFSLRWTGWISLLSKGHWRDFSNTAGSKASILQCSVIVLLSGNI